MALTLCVCVCGVSYIVVVSYTQRMTDSASRDEMVQFARQILNKVTLPGFSGKPEDLWQIGLTKVFLKESQVF